MPNQYNPVSFRVLGEKLPNPQSTANSILRKSGGGGGNTQRLNDCIRLGCADAFKYGWDSAVRLLKARVQTMEKDRPSQEDVEQALQRVKAFQVMCKSMGLTHAKTEHVLRAPLNDIVRVSGRIDHTLIDPEGSYWFILMVAEPLPKYQREYKYPFIKYAAQEQLAFVLNGRPPKVGIYDYATPSFTTFSYSETEQLRLLTDLFGWAENVAGIVRAGPIE